MAEGGPVTLHAFPDARLIIRVSPSQSGHEVFMVRPGRVTCGFHTVQCHMVPDPGVPAKHVYMSTGLLGRLHMEEMAAPIHAHLQRDGVRVGPIIGILCNPRWNARAGTLVESTQRDALEKLLTTAERAGATAYLFRVEDVDFQNLRVRGYMRTHSTWRQVRMPLPDVIYDQLISRKRERTDEHVKLRERLSRLYGDRIFNDGFFDKWQVHEWLYQDKRLHPHLPKTIRYSQGMEVGNFVKRHSTVYLKPVHGSLGLGIVKIANQADGSATYEIKRPNQSPISGRATSPHDAVKLLRKRLTGRPYLLQEGIALATVDGRPFDIRILLQRDGTGEWKRTKSFTRITKPGDITSNLSSGGEAMSMSAVFDRIFPSPARRKQCKAEVYKVSRLVADAMEKQANKTFGELGIDLGVDQNGHVWIIEVNSKPWKSPTTEKGSQAIVDLAFERPIRYAMWLAMHK